LKRLDNEAFLLQSFGRRAITLATTGEKNNPMAHKEWQARLDEALTTIEKIERDGVGRHVIARRLARYDEDVKRKISEYLSLGQWLGDKAQRDVVRAVVLVDICVGRLSHARLLRNKEAYRNTAIGPLSELLKQKLFPARQQFLKDYYEGKQLSATDIDGVRQKIGKQQRASSCGPASVLIIKEMWPGPTYGRAPNIEQDARDAFPKQDWDANGSWFPAVMDALRSDPAPHLDSFEVRTSYSYYYYLKKASQQKPVILSIGWYGQDGSRNGGHWVVCVGPSKDGQWFKVLDPTYGLQYMWTDPKYYLDYWPTHADGRYATQDGVLDGMIVIGKT
jgi:hypothetical protein